MRLVVLETGEAFAFQRSAVVGSSERCDVRVAGLAPEHVRIQGDCVVALADLDVGEMPLRAGESRRFVDRCVLAHRGVRVRVEREEAETSLATREQALRGIASPATMWPAVTIVQGPGVGRQLVMRTPGTFVVGRGDASSLVIEDLDVSRSHLEITLEGTTVLVQDLGSRQGSVLGRGRLEAGRRALWDPEIMMRIGGAVLSLSVPACLVPMPDAAAERGGESERSSPVESRAGEHPSAPFEARATAGIAPLPEGAPPPRTRRSWRGIDVLVVFVSCALMAVAVVSAIWILAS